jgi:chromosome partitioning protein
MTKRIFFGNYKGGVGKTTTVFEVGALMAEKHDKKVLLVDLDPQCSLSKICAKPSNVKMENLNVEETLNFAIELYSEYVCNTTRIEILENRISSNYSIIKDTIKNIPKYSKKNGKLDFIPTVLDMKNNRLNDISERLANNTLNVLIISKLLSDIEANNEYDYILFDCPPTSNIFIQSVFLASDYYLIPSVGDEISTDGVADYITEIESVYLKYAYDTNISGMVLKKYFGNKPELLGVLETIFKPRRDSLRNMPEALDKAISKLGIKSKVTGSKYGASGREHIFNKCIRNLDNRSDPRNFGIPITVSSGEIHVEYYEIAEAVVALT